MKTRIKLAIALVIFIGVFVLLGNDKTGNPSAEEKKQNFVSMRFERHSPETPIPKDTNKILGMFFPDGKITRNNLIGWKPDLESSLSMAISEDGICYTSLDTIIHVDIYKNIDVYIFKTISYMKDLSTINSAYSPDISFALVETTNGKIKSIKSFNKTVFRFGNMETDKKTELVTVGPDKKALKIISDVKCDDELAEKTTLIDLEDLKTILRYESFKSNENLIEDPFEMNSGLKKKEVELTTEISETGAYNIILNQKVTDYDSSTDRTTTHYSNKTYHWNENEELELGYSE